MDKRNTGDIADKLKAIRAAAQHDHPVGDVDSMLAEIEMGYASVPPLDDTPIEEA
jgi:hypothetical protein